MHHKIAANDNGWTPEAPVWKKKKKEEDSLRYREAFSSGFVTWRIMGDYSTPPRVEIEERKSKKEEGKKNFKLRSGQN